MSTPVRDLSRVKSLRDRWVAIAPGGARSDRETPLKLALDSGEMVVDADDELDVLCQRLKAANQTSLTIVWNGSRRS